MKNSFVKENKFQMKNCMKMTLKDLTLKDLVVANFI